MGQAEVFPLTGSLQWVRLWLEAETEEDHVRLHATQVTLGGKSYDYGWGAYQVLRLGLHHVNSQDQALLNQWWQQGRPLGITLDTSAWPSTVTGLLTNKEVPIGALQPPYSNVYQGTLQLEADADRPRLGRPFVLDDVVLGLLDQTYNALL